MTKVRKAAGATSAVRAVMDFVERGVRSGTFSDGRLPRESDIAEQVGVSRTPVREALKILDAVGVIEIRRGIGTFVRPEAASALGYLTMFQTVMKTATTKELYQTRLMVEHAAAEIVAQRGSQEDLRKIIEANERFREVAEAEVADYDLATELDIAFHKTVFAVCGNPLIGAIGNLVIEQVRPWIRESHEVAGLQVTVRMHQELIDGLSNAAESDKSGIELTRAVRIGLESWRERLEKIG